MPRTAQAQYDATSKLGPGDPIEPGDLVFFGDGPSEVTHVGIALGNGEMVDATDSGADVREEPFPTTIGAPWGAVVYVGATTISRAEQRDEPWCVIKWIQVSASDTNGDRLTPA